MCVRARAFKGGGGCSSREKERTIKVQCASGESWIDPVVIHMIKFFILCIADMHISTDKSTLHKILNKY